MAKADEVIEEVKTEVAETPDLKKDTKKAPAKAGKRSSKAIEEAEKKAAKEVRKASEEPTDSSPKQKPQKVRTRAERKGKNYRAQYEKVDGTKDYTLDEAVKLAKATSYVKFDATVEIHINLGVDPRHADQNVRDNLVLPNGTGRSVKVAVLTDKADEAKGSGADLSNSDEILAALEKGQINFDVLVATPSFMPKLGKYARILGPRGLMPNPKSGTVTTDVSKAVTEAKAGKVEYRVDSAGIVHVGVGKVSFDEAKLIENANALVASVKANKPASVKGNYIKAVHVSTSMGPSVKVSLNSVQ